MTGAEARLALEAAGFNLDDEPYIGGLYRVHRDGRSCGVDLGDCVQIVGHKENDPGDLLYLSIVETLDEQAKS
jgi:hypothetical protein